MTRPTNLRDSTDPRDALMDAALDDLERSMPEWGVARVRNHVMNVAEMFFWRDFLNQKPSRSTVTLDVQLHASRSMMGAHVLSNPRFMWGCNSPQGMTSGSPYSHTTTDDSKNEIAALYWPIANRYDEPLREGQGVAFWQEVLSHPRMTLRHQTLGSYPSLSMRIAPSADLTVEPWTTYFAAWMGVRERLGRLSPVERAALNDHRHERRLQALHAWEPEPQAAPSSLPRRFPSR